jgi:LPXTG-motif cell wall-anchored protein
MGRMHVRSKALAGAVLFFQLLPGMDVAAAADPVVPLPENGRDGMLRLTSSVYPLDIPPLSAGQQFSWQVGVVLDGPDSASATVQLQASGALAAGADAYHVTARSCPVQWQGTSGMNARMSCPAGERRILAAASFSAAGTASYPLGSFTAADEPWVLFSLERPRSSNADAGTLRFGIGVVAGGDESSPKPLARTGAEILGYAGAGIVLLAAGAGILLSRRRRPS